MATSSTNNFDVFRSKVNAKVLELCGMSAYCLADTFFWSDFYDEDDPFNEVNIQECAEMILDENDWPAGGFG